MNVIKRILIGLGVVLLGFVALIAVLLVLQSGFRNQHEGFVREFMEEYSRTWDVADVRGRVTNEFLEQSQSNSAAETISFLRRFGGVRQITDVSIKNFAATTNGTSGVFIFKAEFSNAPGLVKLTLREIDGQPKVHKLHIQSVGELPLLSDVPVGI